MKGISISSHIHNMSSLMISIQYFDFLHLPAPNRRGIIIKPLLKILHDREGKNPESAQNATHAIFLGSQSGIHFFATKSHLLQKPYFNVSRQNGVVLHNCNKKCMLHRESKTETERERAREKEPERERSSQREQSTHCNFKRGIMFELH